ncbi:MAG: hypothetical protein RQ750_13545 [Roseovarius sp.]|nr:hypothetical protein [Roseovarius sp.]
MLRQEPGAGAQLRTSIRLEAALVAIILLTTATLTTISAPGAVSQTSAAAGTLPDMELNTGGVL